MKVFRQVHDAESSEDDNANVKVSVIAPNRREDYVQNAGKEKEKDFHACRKAHPPNVDKVYS